MSGHLAGQNHALPLTGLTSLPLVVIGLAVTAFGALFNLARPKKKSV